VIASGLEAPWELTWGPDDQLWVTERKARRVVRVNPADGARRIALTAPERARAPVQPFSFSDLSLTFEELDRITFPAVDMAFAAGAQGGSSPAVLNAADEVAVEAFLQHRLGFLGIAEVVARTLEAVPWREVTDVETVLAADADARATAASLIAGAC